MIPYVFCSLSPLFSLLYSSLFPPINKPSIKQIPHEILCEIFEFIPESWISLLDVSKSFRNTVFDLMFRKRILNTIIQDSSIICESLDKDEFITISKKRIFKLQVYKVACTLIEDPRTVRGFKYTKFDENLFREQVEYLKNSSIYFYKHFKTNEELNATKQVRGNITSCIAGDHHVGRYTFASTVVQNKQKHFYSYNHRGYGVDYQIIKYQFGEDEYEHGLFFPFKDSKTRGFNCRTIPILFALDNEKSFNRVLEIYQAKKKELTEYERNGEFVLIGNNRDRKRVISREVAEKFAFEKMDGSLYFENTLKDFDQPHKIMLYMFLMGQFIL